MVLRAIGPIRALSPSELEPQISDTSTSGTTSSLSEATKMRPTTSKTPSIRKLSRETRTPSESRVLCDRKSSSDPVRIPATIAIRMRLVRLIRNRDRSRTPLPRHRHRHCSRRSTPASRRRPVGRRQAHIPWYTPGVGYRGSGWPETRVVAGCCSRPALKGQRARGHSASVLQGDSCQRGAKRSIPGRRQTTRGAGARTGAVKERLAGRALTGAVVVLAIFLRLERYVPVIHQYQLFHLSLLRQTARTGNP